MTKYLLVNLKEQNFPQRLNRQFIIKSDATLFDLSCVILTSLCAQYCHIWSFRHNNIRYELVDEMEDCSTLFEHYVSELIGTSTFSYDYGEGWTFDLVIEETDQTISSKAKALMLDAKGLGIWEDNIVGYFEYCEGKKNLKDNRKDKWDARFPWNIAITNLSQWDTWCDKTFIAECLKSLASDIKKVKASLKK